jgi:hypothetical protein
MITGGLSETTTRSELAPSAVFFGLDSAVRPNRHRRQLSGVLMSFALVLLSRHRDAGAVHEDDLPGTCLFL